MTSRRTLPPFALRASGSSPLRRVPRSPSATSAYAPILVLPPDTGCIPRRLIRPHWQLPISHPAPADANWPPRRGLSDLGPMLERIDVARGFPHILYQAR